MPCVALSVESSALFRPDGRKAGLGSSAATAAGLTFALLHAAGMRGALLSDAALALSVKAHRTAQGGAGSGYDVVCSLRGGFGLFHGGSVPSWTPCRLAWEPEILLFQGPAPVRTPAAVNAYDGWKRAKPAAARSFLESSNAAVRAFVSARSPQEALRCLAACRQVGCDLGDAIGVPARIDVPAGLDAAWCKALGAGNELGACLGPGHAEAVRAPFSRAASSVEGIVWEP
jgi:mevalonate kinase